MFQGWIKYFVDGSQERGSNEDVQRKVASWTRGRHENMVAVEIHHRGTILRIDGLGEFWQSDVLECSFPESSTKLIKRKIQKKINSMDFTIAVSKINNFVTVTFNPQEGDMGLIEPDCIDKWFTAELDASTGNLDFYIRDDRA